MKRLKVVLGACLAMLVAFTALAWAATQYKTTIKVNGTKLNVQRYVEGKGPMKDKAVLLNKDNKVVVRWKQRELKKWYYDGDKYFRFVPYSYDMKNLKPGRYRLVTTSSFGKGGAVKKLSTSATSRRARCSSVRPRLYARAMAMFTSACISKRIILRARPAMPRFSIKTTSWSTARNIRQETPIRILPSAGTAGRAATAAKNVLRAYIP